MPSIAEFQKQHGRRKTKLTPKQIRRLAAVAAEAWGGWAV